MSSPFDCAKDYINRIHWRLNENGDPVDDRGFNIQCEAQKKINGLLWVQRVIFNDPATIIFWMDGTKTVVQCSGNEPFNPYYGFCAAVAKRVYGNNSRVQKIVKNGYVQKEGKLLKDIPIKSEKKKGTRKNG